MLSKYYLDRSEANGMPLTIDRAAPGKVRRSSSISSQKNNPSSNRRLLLQDNTLLGPLKDARVRGVIERLIETRRRPLGGGPRNYPEVSGDPYDYGEYGFSIGPD